MIKGGIGGGRTHTGLVFESRISLKENFSKIKGYSIEEDTLLYNGRKVAEFYMKHSLYKNLLEKNKIDYKKIISKKLLPDDAIFVFSRKTIYIIEMKFQEISGSVDEKLQTCDFKNKQYHKLFNPLGIDVKYIYILNDWFKKDEYKDVLSYIQEVGCYYFFNSLPLQFLGLESGP